MDELPRPQGRRSGGRLAAAHAARGGRRPGGRGAEGGAAALGAVAAGGEAEEAKELGAAGGVCGFGEKKGER